MAAQDFKIGPKADLRGANLRGANLQGADLWGADLREADLREADLQEANLREANLRRANLREADLRRANLDFSCLPLWCGSKQMKVDRQIALQILAHFCALDCDDMDIKAIQLDKTVNSLALQSHRAHELLET